VAYKETYTRAFNLIINRLMSFPTISGKCWAEGCFQHGKVGDFISLQSAPATEWQLSWVEEVQGERYLLKSAMTGELCWWGNIGITVLKKDEISMGFDWTDRQFKFRDKFCLAIKRNNDYSLTYGGVEFDGFKVKCNLRKRHDFADVAFSKIIEFDDFRKVKASQLNDFYLTTVEEQKPVTNK